MLLLPVLALPVLALGALLEVAPPAVLLLAVEEPLPVEPVLVAWSVACAACWASSAKPAALAATTPDTASRMRVESERRGRPVRFMTTTVQR